MGSHPGVVPARPRAVNKHCKVRGHAEKALHALRRSVMDGDSSDSLPTDDEGFTTDASTTPARLLARPDVQQHKPSVCSTLPLGTPQVKVTLPSPV